MESVDYLPAWKVVELFQARELGPVEYITRCLDRITALEPELHALITVAADSALSEAHRVEDAIRSGQHVVCWNKPRPKGDRHMYGGPRITHLDDVPAEEMLRFRFKDGHTASIWEKWIEMSPRYLAFWNKWDPGAMSPHHGHHGDHINLILKGEIRSKDHVCPAGSHIMLEYGDQFGPWVAGPEGAELYGFVAAEGGSGGSAYPGDADVWQAFLDEHGAESMPVPMPKRMPPWWRAKLATRKVTNWIEE